MTEVNRFDRGPARPAHTAPDAADGFITSRHDYMPFGEEIAPTYPPPIHVEFTGQERDSETNQDYLHARYLKFEVGRFTTVDPVSFSPQALGDPQGYNAYAYAFNSPHRYSDPTGLWPYTPVPSWGTMKRLLPRGPTFKKGTVADQPELDNEQMSWASASGLFSLLYPGWFHGAGGSTEVAEPQDKSADDNKRASTSTRLESVKKVFQCGRRWAAPSLLELSSWTRPLKPVAEYVDPLSQISLAGDVTATIVKRTGPTFAELHLWLAAGIGRRDAWASGLLKVRSTWSAPPRASSASDWCFCSSLRCNGSWPMCRRDPEMTRKQRFPWLWDKVNHRAPIALEDMWRRHFSDYPHDQVLDCLRYLSDECGLPIERLLPDDPLIEWMRPPTVLNPLRWLIDRARFETIVNDLEFRGRRLNRRRAVFAPTLRGTVEMLCGRR